MTCVVSARQFGIHFGKPEESDGPAQAQNASRLADNFEAYIYALYLDQGMETVYDFLCPIFLKKLYSQAKQLDIPLPKQKCVTVIGENGLPEKAGLFARVKVTCKCPSAKSSLMPLWANAYLPPAVSKLLMSQRDEGKICKVEYAGLPLPDWQVPCTNGKGCKRGT